MKIKTGGIADAGLAIIIGLFIGLVAAELVKPTAEPANAQQSAVFDHSRCQYPYRWTNPVNGCDNSDPAVPECIKAFDTEQGEKDCIDAFVALHPVGTDLNPIPVEDHTVPYQAPTNQCGGTK